MQDTTSLDPAGKIHHEDIEVGKTIAVGHKVLTKEEIIAYGRAFDPQPMHVDEEAAKATLVGGLCASGWHTCAIMMRLLCDGLISRMAGLGSPGVDEVRWKKPVRPGDLLSLRYTAREKRVLASRPDVGVTNVLVELVDGKGDVPCTWITNQLTRMRHPAAAPGADRPAGRPKPAMPNLWDGAAPGAPSPDAFFEDRVLGEIADLGQHTFARDEIVAFAREFDPQPFHLDDAAARASLFGALCASGWHTAAHFIRGAVTTRLAANAAVRPEGTRLPAYGPSPGFRDLRWYKPVYVGDTVNYRARLAEKIDLKSRPERGLLASLVQGRNQKGEIVFSVMSQILAERKDLHRLA